MAYPCPPSQAREGKDRRSIHAQHETSNGNLKMNDESLKSLNVKSKYNYWHLDLSPYPNIKENQIFVKWITSTPKMSKNAHTKM